MKLKLNLLIACLLLLQATSSSAYPPNLQESRIISIDKPKFKKGQNQELIIKMTKGTRPDPSNYLKVRYMKRHLRQFKRKASFLIPADILDKFGRETLGRNDGQFVMSAKDMNKLLKKAKGNIDLLEYELGIPNQSWHHRKIIRIDINRPKTLHLRLPNGNEAGANELWIPGGKLPNGYRESVIDPIPLGKYTETTLMLNQ